MKDFHKKRLLKLADFLETLPKANFDLEYFVKEVKDGKLNSCGTVACACGWAGCLPEFRKRGLKTVGRRVGTGFNYNTNEQEYGIEYNNLEFKDKDGEVYTDVGAAERFFGLSYEEFNKLFTTEGYSNFNTMPKTVAKKIRHYIGGGNLEKKF